MSIDLKSSKPVMYTTVLEVTLMSSIIKTDYLNFDINDPDQDAPIISSNADIENFIIKADSIINGYLSSSYTVPGDLLVDAWATPPRSRIFNSNRRSKLIGVKVNKTTASTAYYTIKFTSETNFKVYSSLEGYQGAGLITSDFTSDNGEITIGTNSWDPDISAAEDDEFYFSIIRSDSLINSISTMLAASMLLAEKYTEQIPNENEYPIKLWSKATALLKRLSDPNDPLGIGQQTSLEPETISIDYHINQLGEDKSSYLTENNLDP